MYFMDFFKDAHVLMPDISGYIQERVKLTKLTDRLDNLQDPVTEWKRRACEEVLGIVAPDG